MEHPHVRPNSAASQDRIFSTGHRFVGAGLILISIVLPGAMWAAGKIPFALFGNWVDALLSSTMDYLNVANPVGFAVMWFSVIGAVLGSSALFVAWRLKLPHKNRTYGRSRLVGTFASWVATVLLIVIAAVYGPSVESMMVHADSATLFGCQVLIATYICNSLSTLAPAMGSAVATCMLLLSAIAAFNTTWTSNRNSTSDLYKAVKG